ncbi:50S rRNA methyltransferase [Flavonifractor plautii]|nr:50S rRNA methyltransferase [Flavonifractor plautii]
MEKSLFTCPICAAPWSGGSGPMPAPTATPTTRPERGMSICCPPTKSTPRPPATTRAWRRPAAGFSPGNTTATCWPPCAPWGGVRPAGEAVLDSGCGEGYYTAGLWEALGRPPLAGIDLSKPSVRLAARRVPEGSSPWPPPTICLWRTPRWGWCSTASPLALDEFRRVLRPGGAFLYVVPAADHLWELKQVLYDQPYRNKEEDIPYEGFSYERVEPVEAVVDVAGRRCATCSR